MNRPFKLDSEIETYRLRLRQWKEEDRSAFAAMSANPKVMKYFPKTLNQSESDAVVDFCKNMIDGKGWGIWATELKSSGEFIGIIGLNIPPETLDCSPCVEILWRLAPNHWGKGYATEGAQAALKVGFEQLNLDEIYAFVVPQNSKSRAVMERLQLHDTEQNFEHPHVPEGSDLREHCLYKIEYKHWIKTYKAID